MDTHAWIYQEMKRMPVSKTMLNTIGQKIEQCKKLRKEAEGQYSRIAEIVRELSK